MRGEIMKIFLLFLFTIGLVACDVYTVNNTLDTDVKVNGALLKAGACSEYVDFFGWVGDFPLVFKQEENGDLIGKSAGYKPGNYEIALSTPVGEPASPTVKETTETCEVK